MAKYISIVVMFQLLNSFLVADTINVPTDYPKIQQAIDAAVNGDTVLVEPGTYIEDINYHGKAITVRSISGPYKTSIESEGAEVALFDEGEIETSILEGFTITHNINQPFGIGVVCVNSSPVIRDNIISNNYNWFSDDAMGAGLFLENSNATIENNIIEYNDINIYGSGDGFGAGICCWSTGSPSIINNIIRFNRARNSQYGSGCKGAGIFCGDSVSALIKNNIIEGNVNTLVVEYYGNAAWGGGICCFGSGNVQLINNLIINNEIKVSGNVFWCCIYGGGIFCGNPSGPSNVTLLNNVIYGNSAYYTLGDNIAQGGGIYCGYGAETIISNNIVWANIATTEGDQIHAPSANPTIEYCCIQDGWPGTGNIDHDPLFLDADNGDFHLPYNSPCRDTGDNSAIGRTEYDFEGDPRIAWGGTVDMGADEFYNHLYCTGDFYPSGTIEGKLIGLPGTTPTALFISTNTRDPAVPTAYGDFYIQPPWILVPLVPIPANGVLTLPATVPSLPDPPYDVPVQGLVGLESDSLTNLCVLEVRTLVP